MEAEDKFRRFDYIVVRIVLAVLLVLGAIKITLPLLVEVGQLLLTATQASFY